MPLSTYFRKVFLWRKPVFTELDYVDIIIDNKPLLLLTWKLKNGFQVGVKALGKVYPMREGAIAIQLGPGVEMVAITAMNYWRRRSIKLFLKHTKLDERTAKQLIQKIEEPNKLELTLSMIYFNAESPRMVHKPVRLKPIHIQSKISLRLNQALFNYP